MLTTTALQKLVDQAPILKQIMALDPVVWLNSNRQKMADLSEMPYNLETLEKAAELWDRFAPFFEKAFPETRSAHGYLESPLRELPQLKKILNTSFSPSIQGQLYLKCDNALPIVGSIKARGGFYEVLHYAEQIALEAGILSEGESYEAFASPAFRAYMQQYTIGVGSTGNLGLSIGIISAKLGFKVRVYMSADAKAWKKQLLREQGVEVVELAGDFSEAILAGRRETQTDPQGYFVDDENSDLLFLGYTVGALHLAKQLEEKRIVVDAQHPLAVYSPCGVGGSPGGTAYGLKQIYGDNVHCFFAEPTHSPAVLTGLVTGKMSDICVQDIGLDNNTEADGLAVGRPSNFATQLSKELISGVYTVKDERLFELLVQLKDSESIFLEPSATAGLAGPQRVIASGYFSKLGIDERQVTHVAWATGGDLVPDEERLAFYKRGYSLLA